MVCCTKGVTCTPLGVAPLCPGAAQRVDAAHAACEGQELLCSSPLLIASTPSSLSNIPAGAARGGDPAHVARQGQQLCAPQTCSGCSFCQHFYQKYPILQVLPKLEIPHSQHVKGSNHALIVPPDTASTFQDCHIPCRCCRKGRSRTRDTSRVVIMRSLDVLVCRFGTTS